MEFVGLANISISEMRGLIEIRSLIAVALFATGVADDLLYRKFHNFIFLLFSMLALLAQVLFYNTESLRTGFTGALVAFALMAPLVFLRVLGAGDLKLMIAFGLLFSGPIVLATFFWSLVWGSFMGLIKILLSNRFRLLAQGLVSSAIHGRILAFSQTRIPYTLPLAMGWITHVVILQRGGYAFL